MQRIVAAMMMFVLGSVVGARAQSAEEREAARDVMSKRSSAVVTVLGVAKVRIVVAGREQISEQRLQSFATILEPSGLAVVSLTTLDASDVVAANLAARNRGNPNAPTVDVTAEPTDLRFRLADGREVPVKIVLRDKELDLAFVRPIEAPSTPLPAIDGPSAKAAQLDLLVSVARLPEQAGWQSAASFALVSGVVDKPRAHYWVNGAGLGVPMFDLKGRFIGIPLRLRRDPTDSQSAGPLLVLPADDIREVAKQAK